MEEIAEEISIPTFKRVFFLFIFAIFAILLLLVLPLEDSQLESGTVTLIVDYGEGEVREFVGAFQDDMSAWDLLQQANANSYLKIKTVDTFYPDSIDGVKNGRNGKHWKLYIDDVAAITNPIHTKLKEGNVVLWRFE